MKRILFLVLWTIPILQPQAHGTIEIYANGHKYDSIQAYQTSKKIAAAQSSSTPVVLNSQQEEYVQQEAQKMGVNVDLSKVKTFQVNQKNISNVTQHQLYVLGVEYGVTGALQDFYQTRGQSDFQITSRISSPYLQEAIQHAVTTSNDPKLLISEPGKVRIMAISPDNSER